MKEEKDQEARKILEGEETTGTWKQTEKGRVRKYKWRRKTIRKQGK